jgi:hypothetical protein
MQRFMQRCFPWLVLTLVLLFTPLQGQAQTAKPKTLVLPSAIANDFEKSVVSLSEQMQCAFVVEGMPLFPQLTPQQTEELRKADAPEAFLDKFALAYDYRVLRTKSGKRLYPSAVVLQKRYSHPADIPCVTLEECRNFAFDVDNYYKRIGPNLSSQTELVMGIVETLTPNQLEKLRSGGLPIRSLTQKQRGEIWRMATHLHTLRLQSAAAMYLVHADFATLREITTQIEGVGTGFRTQLEMDYLILRLSRGISASDRLPQPKIAAPEYTDLWKRTTPVLEEALPRLNRLGAGKLTVPQAFLRKPLYLVGEKYSSLPTLTHCLERLYNFRVLSADNQNFTLQQQRIPKNAEIEEMYRVLTEAIPDPLLRAVAPTPEFLSDIERLRAESERILKTRYATKEEGEKSYRRFREVSSKIGYLESESEQRFRLLGAEVARQLYFGAELNLQGKDRKKGVDFPQLDERTRTIYAIGCLLGFADVVRKPGKIPYFITQFDDVVLTGGPMKSPKKPYWEISLNRRSERGGLEFMGGLQVPDRRKKP